MGAHKQGRVCSHPLEQPDFGNSRKAMSILCDRVIAHIRGPSYEIGEEIAPDTSLIQSGLLDSLALFKLALWIESEVRSPLDLTKLEIATVWDTPQAIADFIAAQRISTGS
jgi:acyl carrier protein